MNNKLTPASKIITYSLLILLSIITLFPFYWMISSSLKTTGNIFRYPIQWIPNPIRWENFTDLFEVIPFGTQFFNSLYVALLVTIGVCAFSSLAGYAFAKMHFKGKNIIFLVLLSSVMIPSEATVIPLFEWMSKLKFINTHWPLILPPIFGAAGMFGVFLLRQFFITVPDEIIEASKIDGCGPLRSFSVVAPLAKASLGALFIYTFLNNWNEFLGPLVFLNSSKLYTVPLSLSLLTDQHGTEWNLVMAASTLATLPLLIVFFFAQKQFVEGIAMTGVKG